MQVLVSQVVLPGGWCSFCFYLVGHSSHCSCYLYWNCRSLFILSPVGLFCDQNFLLPNCFIMYLGGCRVFLLRRVLRWLYLRGGSLDTQWSGLPIWWETRYPLPCRGDEPFYFLCCFELTRWVMTGNFFVHS